MSLIVKSTECDSMQLNIDHMELVLPSLGAELSNEYSCWRNALLHSHSSALGCLGLSCFLPLPLSLSFSRVCVCVCVRVGGQEVGEGGVDLQMLLS